MIFLNTSIFAQDLPYDVTRVTEEKEINLIHPDYDHRLRGIKHNDIVYYIDNSLEKVTAFKADGSIKWQVNIDDVFKCPYMGQPGIWFVMIGNQMVYGDVFGITHEELFIVYAKHDLLKLTLKQGYLNIWVLIKNGHAHLNVSIRKNASSP